MIWDDTTPRNEPERIPAPDPRPYRGKVRIRFTKEGTLRFIGHNDLLRIWDRLIRRAELPVRFSEGFNPRPRLSSPLSLAVGLVGAREVVDLELAEPLGDDEIARRLARETVAGLAIVSVAAVEVGARSAAVAVEYRCPLPDPFDRAPVAAAIERLHQVSELVIARRLPGKPERKVDIRPWIEEIRLADAAVWFRCKVEAGGTARPEEVLDSIGLDWLPRAGAVITREWVELASEPRETRNTWGTSPLEGNRS